MDGFDGFVRCFHRGGGKLRTAYTGADADGCGLSKVCTVVAAEVVRNQLARSTEAVRLLRALPEDDPMFGLTSRQLDALWRKLRDRAAVENLHFHDARHEAITRLSRKIDVLALARMVGHRDIKMLLRYYDETAEDLAKRLE